MNRRSFLRGLIAAPAIVAASSIMPVRAIERLIVAPPAPILTGGVFGLEVGSLISIDGKFFRVAAVSDSCTIHLQDAWTWGLDSSVIGESVPQTERSPERQKEELVS